MSNVEALHELLNEEQAGQYVGGLSPVTLQTWRSRGDGPPFLKVGRLVRYRRSDLDAWLESRVRNRQ